jgi:UrcA family protein
MVSLLGFVVAVPPTNRARAKLPALVDGRARFVEPRGNSPKLRASSSNGKSERGQGARMRVQRPGGTRSPANPAGRTHNLRTGAEPAEQETRKMFVRSTFLALAALAATAAAPAIAQSSDSVAVGYGDLNLSSPAGREALERRVGAAARQVCGEYQPLELKMIALSRACRARALAAGQAQFGQSLAAGGAQSANLNVSRAAY